VGGRSSARSIFFKFLVLYIPFTSNICFIFTTLGIRPGDHLVAIAGQSVTDLDLRDVTNMLRGTEGSEVQVRVETASR
jgi:hypothetical protein